MRVQQDQDTPQELPAGDESNRVLELIDTAIKVSKGLDAAGARALEARETMHNRTEHARVSLGGAEREPRLLASRKKRKEKHHGKRKVSFFHYSYYDVAFKFFIEQVLDAEWTPVPPRTKRTIEIGSRYSNDYVCTPFKHILGDYIEALEAGADVLIQTAGPCRLGYYGELHESILRDLGYEFDCLNFAYLAGKGIDEYVKAVKKINPSLSVKKGVRKLLSLAKMITDLDEAYDYYLAHAGAEIEKGAFDRALSADEILMSLRQEKKTKGEIGIDEVIGTDKDGNQVRLIDVMGISSDCTEQQAETSMDVQRLKAAIERVLGERERVIIELRFGLVAGRCKTQREIADLLGISRSYVSRIEKKALRLLRDALEE